MIARQFGRWTVLRPEGRRGTRREAYWHCRCDCGTERVVREENLRGGRSQSCGCLHRELMAALRRTHGHSVNPSPEYKSWEAMKDRCCNPNNTSYRHYGGRGITICEQWRNSFEAFYATVGPRPSSTHSIDRINNDGNYEPGNVRWATRIQQANNKRKAIRRPREPWTFRDTLRRAAQLRATKLRRSNQI
jgi:hypothetical protein